MDSEEITTRTFARFSGRRNLYLETADYRRFTQPYGPHYPHAVGRVYQLGSGDMEWGSETILAHVKKVSPNLPLASQFPISVDSEKINEDRRIVKLSATIKFDKESNSWVTDTHRVGGRRIELELYVEETRLKSEDRPD